MVLLSPSTSTSTSAPITVGRASALSVPATAHVIGALDGSEEVVIQYYEGNEWRNSQVTLSVGTPMRTLYSPLTVRFIKPITVNVVGIGINSAENVA